MNLTIEGQQRELTDIRTFRALHGLPADFGVAYFEPKDYTGLGSIEGAGAVLNQVRDAVLDYLDDAGLPDRGAAAHVSSLMVFLPRLAGFFRDRLRDINDQVRLRDVEIDYAVSGFDDVNHRLLYALAQAQITRTPPPTFEAVYQSWLDDSCRVSSTVHKYPHRGMVWHIQIINHAYGRVGLVVQRGDHTEYISDAALACPAEGFMYKLLAAVAEQITSSVGAS